MIPADAKNANGHNLLLSVIPAGSENEGDTLAVLPCQGSLSILYQNPLLHLPSAPRSLYQHPSHSQRISLHSPCPSLTLPGSLVISPKSRCISLVPRPHLTLSPPQAP